MKVSKLLIGLINLSVAFNLDYYLAEIIFLLFINKKNFRGAIKTNSQ